MPRVRAATGQRHSLVGGMVVTGGRRRKTGCSLVMADDARPQTAQPMSLNRAHSDLTPLDQALLQAILVALETDESIARRIAEAVCPYLPRTDHPGRTSGWLDFDGAIEHLGMKIGTLYKLTAARQIPFHQDGPGCRLWFLRSELDEWRRSGGSRAVRSRPLKAA
jgi:hypothetical protein